MRNPQDFADTLCWKCRHAVPTNTLGCPWSMDGIPIEGWDADVRIAKEEGHHTRNSYEVHDCPMFLKDRPAQEVMDGSLNAFRGFGMAIVTQCVNDYREYYWRWIANKEWLELCIKKNQRFDDVRYWVYEKKQIARRRKDEKMLAFFDEKFEKIKKRYEPFAKWGRIGIECRRVISDCERFFKTEEFTYYSDMDGIRVMHLIQSELHERYKEEIGGGREEEKG